MKFDRQQRRVHMSVREFAAFHAGPRRWGTGPLQPWRSQLGTAAHAQLAQEADTDGSASTFESPIQGTLCVGDWHIVLQGRIDKVTHAGEQTQITEFKTVSAALPLPAADAESRYADYFDQLAAYLALADILPDWESANLTGELLLHNLSDGFRQALPMSLDEARRRVAARCEILLPFLNHRWQARIRHEQVAACAAFATLREGQADAITALDDATMLNPVVLFQAPTGFGKTGIVLQHALQRLSDGHFNRLIYLTGKATGQLEVVRQLGTMLTYDEGLPAASVLQLRNKSEHSARCQVLGCDARASCTANIEAQWKAAALQPWQLLERGSPDIDTLASVAARAQLCPFELTKSLLPYADIWVCDYNYLFSPGAQAVLETVPGYDPAQTCCLIDEAHNLSARVADCYSFTQSEFTVRQLLDALLVAKAPPRLINALEQWARLLRGLQPCDALDTHTHYEAIDTLEQLARCLSETPLQADSLQPQDMDQLYAYYQYAQVMTEDRFETLCWSPQNGQLRVSTLDASPAIAATLKRFGTVLAMSATLEPRSDTIARLGMVATPPAFVEGHAPWRANAYDVATDVRVDTRMKYRSDSYATTAETLTYLCQQGITAVFFSSYHYAETVRAYVQAVDRALIVAMQPRTSELHGQLHFIESSLLSAHLLFFVLGSSFSEGIDQLGGRVSQAVIVGPALPEVNAEQRKRLDNLRHLSRDEAFRQVYLIPAMRKINQALGRLVRAPGQRAKVLLHGRRFADPAYQQLLMPEYRNGQRITHLEGLRDWVAAPLDAPTG